MRRQRAWGGAAGSASQLVLAASASSSLPDRPAGIGLHHDHLDFARPYRTPALWRGSETLNLVDHSRGTPANGSAPALPYRT